MHQLGVRREGNRLLLHGRVDDHLPKVRGLGGSHPSRDGQALLDQRDELVLPMRWRQRVENGNTGNAGINGDIGGGWTLPERADFPFSMEDDGGTGQIGQLRRSVVISADTTTPRRKVFFKNGVTNTSVAFPDRYWLGRWHAFRVLRQFAEERWDKIPGPGKEGWDTDALHNSLVQLLVNLTSGTPTGQTKELAALAAMARDERASALGEILTQDVEFITAFMEALTITPGSNPKTFRILHIASLIGSYTALHFKETFDRPRPSYEVPALLPPIPVPGHSAFPSGHATQAHLMVECIDYVYSLASEVSNPDRVTVGKVLRALARRVARNREIAGLHYPTDSEGGRLLAAHVIGRLSSLKSATGDKLKAGDYKLPAFGRAAIQAAKELKLLSQDEA